MRWSVGISFVAALACASPSGAAEYACTVQVKFDTENVYTAEQLAKRKFSVQVIDEADGARLARCSFAVSAGKITCDSYDVDRVEVDPVVRIKKFYVFGSQFDVQLFPDLTFLENNGRGGIAFGRCTLLAP